MYVPWWQTLINCICCVLVHNKFCLCFYFPEMLLCQLLLVTPSKQFTFRYKSESTVFFLLFSEICIQKPQTYSRKCCAFQINSWRFLLESRYCKLKFSWSHSRLGTYGNVEFCFCFQSVSTLDILLLSRIRFWMKENPHCIPSGFQLPL